MPKKYCCFSGGGGSAVAQPAGILDVRFIYTCAENSGAFTFIQATNLVSLFQTKPEHLLLLFRKGDPEASPPASNHSGPP